MKFLMKLRHSGLIWLWVALLVIVLDRVTKIWVIDHLIFEAPLRVLPFFNLHIAFNTGAAFSFLQAASGWQNWFLGGLAFVISTIIVIWLWRLSSRSYWLGIALCLILGGALGNAWDRILYGYVIDFLSFHWGDWYFAIFNAADSAICAGAIMVLLYWLRYEK